MTISQGYGDRPLRGTVSVPPRGTVTVKEGDAHRPPKEVLRRRGLRKGYARYAREGESECHSNRTPGSITEATTALAGVPQERIDPATEARVAEGAFDCGTTDAICIRSAGHRGDCDRVPLTEVEATA